MTKSKKTTTSVICLLVAALICSCFMLSGCTFFRNLFGYVDFTRSQLRLEVGDSYDLSDIISSKGNYTLRFTSAAIASVDGTVLTANKKGKTRIIAEVGSYSSALSVTVTEVVPDSLEIEYDGELIQTVGDVGVITFTAVTTGTLDNTEIDWYVNGELKSTGYPEEPFEFFESDAGLYEIKAVGGDIVRTQTVRVYYPISANGTVTGETRQEQAPYSSLMLGVAMQSVTGNPDNYVQWYLDGEIIYEGTNSQYVYSPAVGQHTLTLKVNGVRREIDGKNYATLYIVGSIVPNISSFDFDNLYPHAYLVAQYEGKAQIEITSPSGGTKEYSQTLYGGMFTENGIDVGTYIDLAAASGTSAQTYRFRVKSLGDGGALTESEYSEYFSFTQVPSAAGQYLRERYTDKDYYITSETEYVNLMEYHILYRDKTASKPRVSFDCYIAFDYAGDGDDLFEDAFDYAATSGSCESIRTQIGRDNVMHTAFTVSTVNNPTRQTKTATNSGSYATQMHAIAPHINYDESKYRAADYEFAIDRRENTESVRYSDELYFAAENNSRPLPVSGSSADTLYEMARSILRKIVTDDMTDAEKAHAIYDWIMWQVTYDMPATNISSKGESYSAYYLEGVFGDGKTLIDGVAYAPYAVCDGISKAYSLMCNIEGIPCKRVTGLAGSSIDDAGGHAWNKVFIDGDWYVVDCTWGDSYVDLDITGQRLDYELGIHDNLFRTDDEMDETHFEPFESGDSNIDYSPVTADKPYDIYSSMTVNGTPINCMVKSNENQKTRLQEIAKAFARVYTKRSIVKVPGGMNDGVYSVNFEGIDIYLENGLDMQISEAQNIVKRAVSSVLPFATVKAYNFDNTFIILIRG